MAAAVSFSNGVRLDEAAIHGCCASPRFVKALVQHGSPFADLDALIAEARRVWWQDCGVGEWLAAFAAHPKIGQKKEAQQGDASSAVFANFSKSEQSAAAQSTTDQVAQELLLWNQRYDEKFGFIFIICARGRSSPDILAVLKQRYQRMAHEELLAAAQEQMKITELRLTALYNERAAARVGAQPHTTTTPEAQARMQRRAEQVLNQVVAAHTSGPLRSPITTHVLDASLGRPAKGLPITLLKQEPASKSWETVSSGLTNEDGRIGNLLPPGNFVTPGRYRMHFDTATYLAACRQQHPAFYSAAPFYPEVTVDFDITPDKATEHYHIPLLFSPYSYSTYRGS